MNVVGKRKHEIFKRISIVGQNLYRSEIKITLIEMSLVTGPLYCKRTKMVIL